VAGWSAQQLALAVAGSLAAHAAAKPAGSLCRRQLRFPLPSLLRVDWPLLECVMQLLTQSRLRAAVQPLAMYYQRWRALCGASLRSAAASPQRRGRQSKRPSAGPPCGLVQLVRFRPPELAVMMRAERPAAARVEQGPAAGSVPAAGEPLPETGRASARPAGWRLVESTLRQAGAAAATVWAGVWAQAAAPVQ
jgi:hypothetical protein